MTDLFDDLDFTAAKHLGNECSNAAHESIKGTKSRTRDEVYHLIASAGWAGATREEVADAMGKATSAISGRATELIALGRIVESGRTRLTASGKAAGVLVVTREA